VPGRADLGDWLRDKLSSQLGEVPSFRAEIVLYGGVEAGIGKFRPHPPRCTSSRTGGVFTRETRRIVVVTHCDHIREIVDRASA
jgi:hypothetical protein